MVADVSELLRGDDHEQQQAHQQAQIEAAQAQPQAEELAQAQPQPDEQTQAQPQADELALVQPQPQPQAEELAQAQPQPDEKTQAEVQSQVEAYAHSLSQAEVQAEAHAEEGLQETEVDPYQYDYSWPILSFEETPQRLYHFHHQFKAGINNNYAKNNFLKGAKWSPDGSCFLVSSEDCFLRVFDLPSNSDCYARTLSDAAIYADSFESNLELCEGESVYDFCWYPHMSASAPDSCVFATTTRDHPVHLWDAITGQLRCSYRAYDAMDEITAAYSIAFDVTGAKLFCGYNKTIRVFDTSCPGRDFKQQSTITSTRDGQTGIISCLAFNPCNTGVLAAGSYDRTTGVYAEDNIEPLFVLHGQEGGVTQVQFSKDGNYLYTGGRKDSYILCWDLRNTSGTVYKLERQAKDTNQRIYFDIEPCGRHLCSGGQDGDVRAYDLQTGQLVTSFQVATDTCNGFSFHPSLPLGVSTSGHRRYVVYNEETEDKDFTDAVEEKDKKVLENCASIWRFPCSWDNTQMTDLQADQPDSDMINLDA